MEFRCTLATTTVLAILLVAIAPTQLEAQVAGATLSGLVKDPSGAAIPGASVSIKNLSTGDLRELSTNKDGLYSAPNLLPGSYEVAAFSDGFKRTVRDIVLTGGAHPAGNFS